VGIKRQIRYTRAFPVVSESVGPVSASVTQQTFRPMSPGFSPKRLQPNLPVFASNHVETAQAGHINESGLSEVGFRSVLI